MKNHILRVSPHAIAFFNFYHKFLSILYIIKYNIFVLVKYLYTYGNYFIDWIIEEYIFLLFKIII